MDIVEELRTNRESGAKRLESEYKAGLMTLAMRFCDSPSDAEELVNRTFAAVVEGIDDYLEQSAFFGWMCQILKNIHSLDQRRKSNRNEICTGEIPDIIDEAAQEEIYNSLDRSLVREALGKLEPEDREVLLLHYFMDVPIKKMAQILTVPTGTVKSRLHYARKALAAKLGVAARKPGGKALLLALLLFGLTALGAGIAGVSRVASRVSSPAATETSGQETSDSRQAETSNLQISTSSNLPQSLSGVAGSPQRGAEGSTFFSQGETMNLSITTRTTAALASALAIQAAIPATSATAGSVWQDALLWFNGPVDANNDGKWTGNKSENGVPRKCDGTGGATCEMPDARHGALASSNSQKLNYSTGSATVYQQSGFLIRTNDVHFTAWGNKTVAWPCLYLPQTPSGDQYVYSQRWSLEGGQLITGNQWTVLFRCRIDDFCTVGNNSWLWCTKTDTSKGGEEKEIRFGFGRNNNNTSDTTNNYVKVILGGGQNAFTDLYVATNEWLEVAVVVDGRAENHSIRASLARPGNVRWYRDFEVPYSHSSHTTNFYPKSIWIGGPRYYGSQNGNDNFRGDVQMLAMWNRCLSDREVCEAFGGGSPNLFRIGEENCTAEMFGGAAPASGATVTLDPLASDKRAFPTTLTPGATFRIPFSVDKYAANAAHWVRFKAQAGSASGTLAVALDSAALDPLSVSSGRNAYIWVPGEKFTIGDHVLTLTRTDGGSGSVKFDVIELGGAWSAGIADNSLADVTSDSTMNQTYIVNGKPVKYAPDTWYPDSLNLKEFVRYVGRNKSGTLHRPKTIVWNLPDGAAGKFGMQMSYKILYKGETPLTNSLVTTVNDSVAHTNNEVTGNLVSFKIEPEDGLFQDGENTIVLDFLQPTRTDGKTDWVSPDMVAIEPLRPKNPFAIIVR